MILGPCPVGISQDIVPDSKRIVFVTGLGAKITPKQDRTLVLVKVTLRTLKKGKDGWYAAVKFTTPLPADVSFASGIIKILSKYFLK